MPLSSALAISLAAEQRAALEGLARAHGTPQQLALRAGIILLGGSGTGVRASARELGLEPKTVRHWRQRWLSKTGEAGERLADAPRSGAPASLTAEQVRAIVALACEPPSAQGRPISHGSQGELARAALRRGVATRISQRSVGRMLKRSRPRIGPAAGSQAASGASLAHAQARS